MLELVVPTSPEGFDENTNRFVQETFVLQLEHSLVSLSKWESFFKRPFLGPGDKTSEETLWYIKAMVLTPDVPPQVFDNLTNENIEEINKYVNDSQTATTFNEAGKGSGRREIITAEVVYSWLVTMNIPFECQHWHLNRLITLVRVIQHKTQPQKKMSPSEIARRNRELNAQRRAALGSSG